MLILRNTQKVSKEIGLVKGDIVFFLNSDDWISETTIEKAVSFLNAEKLELVYGVCNRVDLDKKKLGAFQKKYTKHRELWNFGFSFTTTPVTSWRSPLFIILSLSG